MNTYSANPSGLPEPPASFAQSAYAPTFAAAAAAAAPQTPAAAPAMPVPQPPLTVPLVSAMPAAAMAASDPVERQADSFSKTSSAFVVLGLALVGGAIVPLLEHFAISGMVAYFISVAYILLACLTVAWLAGKLFAHSAQSYRYARITRLGVLFAGELSVYMLAGPANLGDYGAGVLAITMALVPLALQVFLNERARWNSYSVLRANEILVMAFMLPVLLFGNYTFEGEDTPAILMCAPAILFGAVIAMHTLELARSDAQPAARNGVLLVTTAVVYTMVLACCLFQFTHEAYAFDMLLMLAALVCTMIGFGFNVAALRRAGLVFALATVVKMVTLDTLGFDPLGKAVAYLLGGAVCFALGAMYNYAVKRLDKREGQLDEQEPANC